MYDKLRWRDAGFKIFQIWAKSCFRYIEENCYHAYNWYKSSLLTGIIGGYATLCFSLNVTSSLWLTPAADSLIFTAIRCRVCVQVHRKSRVMPLFFSNMEIVLQFVVLNSFFHSHWIAIVKAISNWRVDMQPYWSLFMPSELHIIICEPSRTEMWLHIQVCVSIFHLHFAIVASSKHESVRISISSTEDDIWQNCCRFYYATSNGGC